MVSPSYAKLLAVGCSIYAAGSCSPTTQYFYPQGLHVGAALSTDTRSHGAFTLNSSNPLATLDYGYEVAGYPHFEVSALQGPVQIEVKYSEPFTGLSSVYSDGPYYYSVGLSNSYRVETFGVNSTGSFDAFLLQGGLRWQSIKLLTPGSITFSKVGLEASISIVDIDNLPGRFKSNNSLINNIWKTGARAASAACVKTGTQRAIWEISKSNGALVRGMRSALSTKGNDLVDYTLSFSSKIQRGGTGWAVAYALAAFGGIQLNLIGDLPSSTTFVNVNTTLTPRNSIIMTFGYGLVNQTTLTVYHLDTFPIPFAVRENEWHNITTTMFNSSNIAVAINGTQIFNVSLNDYYYSTVYPEGPTAATKGSFGFGPYQDQAAYIKDVTVHDTKNGSLLYSNSMTDVTEVLPEFGVQANDASVCLDGPKRDRLVWLGDFYHTAHIIPVSTGRFDLMKGSLDYFMDWQFDTGEWYISPPMGYPSTHDKALWAYPGQTVLPDYQALGLMAYASYVSATGDLQWAKSTWPSVQANVEFLISGINTTLGLPSFPGLGFIGPSIYGTALSCAMVQAFNEVAVVAMAINDTASAANYTTTAAALSKAINKSLWNPDGFYSIDLTDPGNFSVSAIAFAITSGVASGERATQVLSHLADLKLGPGYKDTSAADSNDPSTNISPNTNGFLLAALLKRNQTTLAKDLLENVWGAMVTNVSTSTGASWEYLNQQSQPGLGLFTSLSHPWGGAATYLLTQYVAGIRRVDGPAGFGYKNWVIEPALFDWQLDDFAASVPTPYGTLGLTWKIESDPSPKNQDCTVVKITVDAPKGTTGTLIINGEKKGITGRSVSVPSHNNMKGGEKHTIKVALKH